MLRGASWGVVASAVSRPGDVQSVSKGVSGRFVCGRVADSGTFGEMGDGVESA